MNSLQTTSSDYLNEAPRTQSRPDMRMDARVAIVATLAYSISVFLVDTWIGMAVFAMGLGCCFLVYRVPLVKILKSVVVFSFILVFAVLGHLPQGLAVGLFYGVRILLLSLATLAVAFTLDHTKIVRAFESYFGPLQRFGIPVDDYATMFSIAIRFIPICMEEFLQVDNAQRSRGSQLDDGPVFVCIRAWAGVIIPMLVGMFRRASSLAQGMECRCYGAAPLRTSLHGDDRLSLAGWIAAIVICAACLATGILL